MTSLRDLFWGCPTGGYWSMMLHYHGRPLRQQYRVAVKIRCLAQSGPFERSWRLH